MLTRGIFHAITDDDLKELRRTKDGPKRRKLVQEWDERWPLEWRCSTDKAWKFLYIALAFQKGPAGGRPEIGQGLGADMFYGKNLHRANFYVIGHVPHAWLPEIVSFLDGLDVAIYHGLYFSPEAQGRFAACCFPQVHGINATEERWVEYTWNWLQTIRDLFRRALDGKRSLIFNAHNC
ncbi:MAG TPA: DUF1877 family protein [Gemmataceae bacterium]|nr:DUF1877 family protein [Gemmataceae bacterium]